MKHIKNLGKCIIWPVLLGIGQFCILLGMTEYFIQTKVSICTKENIQFCKDKLLAMKGYEKELSLFINHHIYIVILINMMILLPIFFFVYHKNKIEKDIFSGKYIFPCFCLGISTSLLFNLVLFSIHQTPIIKSTFLMIISTGIVGPILEEVIFRGIVYEKLQNNYSKKASVFITTILFALMHSGLQILYAFIMGLLFIYVLEKYKSILSPILVHSISNITVSLCTPYLFTTTHLNQIFIIGLCILTILYFMYTKKQNI